MSKQLPFDLTPVPDFSFENFVVGESNRDAFSVVSAFPDWPAPVLILDGPEGCGKTHLGQAWAGCFENVLFIDDAASIDEYELFSHINMALNGDNAGTLLVDKFHADRWDITLQDLRSRLDFIPKFSIAEPGDDVLEAIIRKLFEDRGRDIKADIVTYILTHCERSVFSISQLIDKVETEARSAKRDVTRSFLIQVLKGAGDL